MPSEARRTRPCRISSGTIWRAMSIETEKQMPCAAAMIAVLTPITRPAESSSGPPELPGFSAASVCTTSSIRRPVVARRLRPSALTTPAVTVHSKPNGLPIATTSWPTRIAARGTQLEHGQRLRVRHAQQRDVGVRIDAEHVGREPETRRRQHLDAARAGDDVRVGQHEAVRREHETGSAAAGHVAAAFVGALGDRDGDDAGRGALGNAGHDARIRIERRRLVGGWVVPDGMRVVSVVGVVDVLDVEHQRHMGMPFRHARRATSLGRPGAIDLAPAVCSHSRSALAATRASGRYRGGFTYRQACFDRITEHEEE